MMHSARHDDAVSEVIGTILLIAIVVTGIAVAAAFLWSQPTAQKVPEFGASISNSSCNISLVHTGGDTIGNMTILLLVDGADQTVNFRKQGSAGPWQSWGIGETLVYIPPMCFRSPQRVEIIYRYGSSGSIITTGYFENPLSENFTPRLPPLPVIASFSGTPTSGAAPLTVQFTDTSSGSPLAWNWTFGDGGMSSAQSPSYIYQNVNNYSVSLTVSNGTANSTQTRTDYITVNAPPIIANFSGTPTSGAAPLAVTFTDSSTGTPTTWNWTFGDIGAGNTSTAQNPSHSYATHGRYPVNLTVTNASGGRNTLIKTNYITVTPTPPWYSCSWGYRKNITIDKSKVPSDQTNFPVLINLVSDPDLSASAQGDGDDILFTSSDGTTKLSHEIERYTGGSGALVAWVKVPTLTSSANTTIYLYYGNLTSASQQDKNNVWTASFQSVWHLNETTGGSGAIKDSTSSANHGTDQGSPTLGAAGKFGNAVTLDGVNDYINTTTSYNQPQTFTASLWFKTTNTAATRKIFGFENTQAGITSGSYDRHIYVDTGGYVLDGVYDGATKIVATGSGAKNDGNWHHAVMTHASTTLKLYVDGSFIGQNTTTGAENFVGWWRMGSYKLTGWPRSLGDGYFPGTLDEVRTSTVERSSDWITTEYNNQNSPATFHYLRNQEQWTC